MMKLNLALIVSFALATTGSILILKYPQETFWIPMFCLCARTGICAAFNIIYHGHSKVFPDSLYTASMSVCSLIARVVTIGAPMVSELPHDIPMMVYATMSAGGLMIATLLSENTFKKQ